LQRHPVTRDGPYFVVRGRLWRTSDPGLPAATRDVLVRELMAARRAVAQALRNRNAHDLALSRARVDQAKRALGERGPVWWNDGTNYNRRMAKNTPYAGWFGTISRKGPQGDAASRRDSASI
jgi:hypothetical protein